MQTKCPQCTIIFKVSDKILSIADEQVRCSSCKHVFNGRDHLIDDTVISKPKNEKDHDFSIADIKRRIKGEQSPSMPNYFWLFSAILISLLLLVQIAWLNKSKLAEHPSMGNAVKTFCHKIPGCVIEDKRDSNAFSLSTRQIYSHPNEDNALILSASFTNGANFAQPYPLLLVSMSDKQGIVIAERYFKPEEYRERKQDNKSIVINHPTYQQTALMQSNESITINLTLADPGKDALAFEIDFL